MSKDIELVEWALDYHNSSKKELGVALLFFNERIKGAEEANEFTPQFLTDFSETIQSLIANINTLYMDIKRRNALYIQDKLVFSITECLAMCSFILTEENNNSFSIAFKEKIEGYIKELKNLKGNVDE